MLITTKFLGQTSTKPDRIKVTYGAEELILDLTNPKLNQFNSERHSVLTSKHISAAMELAHILDLPPMQWHMHDNTTGFIFVGAEGGSNYVIPF